MMLLRGGEGGGEVTNTTISSDGRNTFFTHVRRLVSVDNQTTVTEETPVLIFRNAGLRKIMSTNSLKHHKNHNLQNKPFI